MNKIFVAILVASSLALAGCGSIVVDPLGGYNERQIEKANKGTLDRYAAEREHVALVNSVCPKGWKLPDNARAATINSRVTVRNNTDVRARNNRGVLVFPERDSRVVTNVNANQNCVLDR